MAGVEKFRIFGSILVSVLTRSEKLSIKKLLKNNSLPILTIFEIPLKEAKEKVKMCRTFSQV